MSTKPLGRLHKVELREAWASESSAFTPWLAEQENLKLLGDAIGINLELEAKEKSVEQFRADILCKDTATDHWVLIENQLEVTDHTHLGQLLTYAAGLDAVTIVWVAKQFTEAHRAVIDWLNEKTEEGINFFALEVELWRIGDSPLAPKFNVVSKPNEWTRSVAVSAKNSEASQLRCDYWSAFVKQPELQSILTSPLKANRTGNLRPATKWRDFKLSCFFSIPGKYAGIYVTCRGDNGGENFRQFLAQKTELEKKLGGAWWWTDETVANNRGYFGFRVEGFDSSKTEDWPRQHELLATKIVEFYDLLDPYVQELESSSDAQETGG